MIIKEYRVIMPLSLEEYKFGQLWSVAEASRHETGGGDGVEILVNDSFENFPLLGDKFNSGQFTKKKYHLANKVNGLMRTILPKTALVLEENAWNSYPYCRTVLTNEYMGEDFGITIESYHLPGRGELNNVHELPADKLGKREVIFIDIAAELSNNEDYDAEEDPKLFKSAKAKRGPLAPGWAKTADPVMTCYKLVTCHFNWFGMQGRVENMIQRYEHRLFTKFHRQLFCWLDRWYGLSMDDIRKFETVTQQDLETQRAIGPVRGGHVTD